MKTWVIDNRFWIVNISLPILYFAFLLQFYLIDYQIPDFRLYVSFAQGALSAKDGFSSLFVWFAGWGSINPQALLIFCLLLMSASIFNLLLFYRQMFCKNFADFLIAAAILCSCSAWYYFYGKIFYDFPFSIFTYSLSALVFCKFFKTKDIRFWLLFCLMLGLTLSWKPYNIFMVAGLGLLILCKDSTREFALQNLNSKKAFIKSFAAFCIGYLIGNYAFLMDPYGTLRGIAAYRASFNLSDFFFTKARIIWDHINDLPFNVATMCAISAILILFALPIATKKYKYLLVSLFMLLCFFYFVSFHSPGFAWHGFTFGAFIVTFAFFMLSEIKDFSIKLKILLGVILIPQFVINFVINIPMQANWHSKTQAAIQIQEQEQNAIFNDVMSLIETQDLDHENYIIENIIKRYQPMKNSESKLKINKRGHITATNIIFVDPLVYSDPNNWSAMPWGNLWNATKEYVIYIIPNPMKTLNDVANVKLYDNKAQKVLSISRQNYEVILYKLDVK